MCNLGCPQQKNTRNFFILSLRERPTENFNDTTQHPRQLQWQTSGVQLQGLVAPWWCKYLAKRWFGEGTGNDVRKCMIRSWLSNVLDCYDKLLLAQAGIDAQAPFFSCQIQWTQPSFPWYKLSVWVISLCTSVRLMVVSEYQSLALVHVLLAFRPLNIRVFCFYTILSCVCHLQL